MADLSTILGVANGPSVGAPPAPTQADVDAMVSLKATAQSVEASLNPVQARLTVKRAQVSSLQQQLATAQKGQA